MSILHVNGTHGEDAAEARRWQLLQIERKASAAYYWLIIQTNTNANTNTITNMKKYIYLRCSYVVPIPNTNTNTEAVEAQWWQLLQIERKASTAYYKFKQLQI